MARKNEALPQVEATVSLSITSKLMKFTARQDFVVGNCQVKKGETCFAVQSERRPGRFYIVRFNTERATYQCSCGANCKEHAHLKVVREYVLEHVVRKPVVCSESNEVHTPDLADGSRPLTAAEWKAIHKADKARQKAWADEYRQAALAAS